MTIRKGMTGLICGLSLGASLLTAGFVGAQPASAATNFRVCNGSAAIRSTPIDNGNIIGWLHQGEVFSGVANAERGYDYGYAYGSVHAYGYMIRSQECPA